MQSQDSTSSRLPTAVLPMTAQWGVPLFLAVVIAGVALTGANDSLFRLINGVGRYTGDALWANLTILADAQVLLALLALLARWRPDLAWSLLLAALLGTLVVHGIKEAVDLPRPPTVLPAGSFHLIGPKLIVVSFPSGHATTVAIFGAMLLLHLRHRWLPVVLVPLVLIVAFSRVVVGVHWPLDVLAGLLTGWLLATASAWLARRWQWGLGRPMQTALVIFSMLCAAALWWVETGYTQALVLQRGLGVVGVVTGLSTLVYLWRPGRRPPSAVALGATETQSGPPGG